jgi:hypothetical protein
MLLRRKRCISTRPMAFALFCDVFAAASEIQHKLVRMFGKVLQNADEITASATSGPILRSVRAAQEETATLLGRDRLAAVGEAISDYAAERGFAKAYGCSVAGHTLVGAAALMSTMLEPWRPGSIAPVLLVDGVVAGLAGIDAAADAALRSGATRVEVVVLGTVGQDTKLRRAHPVHVIDITTAALV